ncbi:glycosyltransferase [Stenotrophomonas sp. Y-13]|uniref:glycosyltransferase n=1 Tax=Stenotrophomonas sp. Y-13 TaxID=3384161 RepID=UPI0039176175
MSEEKATRLLVAGVGLRGSGYPNARNTLRTVAAMQRVEVIECGRWLPEDTHLWKITKGAIHRSLPFFARLLAGNVLSAMRLLLNGRRGDLVYVPYPSLFLLWLLSWLPCRWRPRCICDAYITLWDTFYQDRHPESSGSRTSRLLLAVESRALRAAWHIVTDTEANAAHLSDLFQVPRESISAFPLALDPLMLPATAPCAAKSANSPVRMLFIGTFVPLQGTTVIAQAIDRLRGQPGLEFVLIGDGQQADEAAVWLRNNPAVTWLRGWQPPQVLSAHLAQADICLGVFGGQDKAARVLPFKLYMALAAGKAIITQQNYSLPDRLPALPAYCTPADAQALADAIVTLAASPEQRRQLERKAATYYTDHLSTEMLRRHWQSLLADKHEPGQSA